MFEKDPFDDLKIARYAQLGLRLLGVMFLVEGAAGAIGGLVYAVMQMSALERAGYEPFPDYYVFGWLGASVATLIAGVYLTVDGSWILQKVFLPSANRAEDEDDDDEQ